MSFSPKIQMPFLRCLVDAANPKSYAGSGTTWTDLSIHGNNFTLSNVTYNSGGWFSFNGSTSYAEMSPQTPNNFTFDGAQSTVSVLFRPTSNQGGVNKAIFTDNFGPEVGIWYNGTNVQSYVYAGTPATATSVNAWCNATMVIPYSSMPGDAGSGSTGSYRVRQYVNGILSGSDAAATVGNGLNDWPITLGYDWQSGTPTAYFTGDIAWVAIWQDALSDTQVKNIYNSLSGRM